MVSRGWAIALLAAAIGFTVYWMLDPRDGAPAEGADSPPLPRGSETRQSEPPAAAPSPGPAIGPAPSSAGERSLDATPGGEAPTQQRTSEISLSLLEHEVGQALAEQGQVYLQIEGDELVGLYVRSVHEGSRLEAMAVEAEDVITRFNGLAIDSPARVQRIVPLILDGVDYHLVVERGGRQMSFHGRWE